MPPSWENCKLLFVFVQIRLDDEMLERGPYGQTYLCAAIAGDGPLGENRA